MKIYVITSGSYSDYHIDAVTDDKEKAEFLKMKFSDEYDSAYIEEYDTDEYSVEGIRNIKLFYWKVFISNISNSNSEVYPYLSGKQYFDVNDYGVRAVVIAKTKEQAIKIVRDRYAQYLSEQAEKQVDNIFKVFDRAVASEENEGTTLDSYLKEQLKDPEFAKVYKEAKEEVEKELKETENEDSN